MFDLALGLDAFSPLTFDYARQYGSQIIFRNNIRKQLHI